jgi:hypothetical protein
MAQQAFIELLEDLLTIKLQKFLCEPVTGKTIVQIYGTVTDAIMELFNKCEFNLSNLSKKFVVQELFKCLTINGSSEFMHLVISNEIKVKELPYTELKFLCNLLIGASFHEKLEQELFYKTQTLQNK